jgi:membrane protease YdiL (CAAX protease family)
VPWFHVALFMVLALGLGLGSKVLVDRGADPLLQLVAVTSPLLAALIVRKVVAREGFADAHLGIRGVAPRYWALAALLPLAWNTAGTLFDVVAGTCVVHPAAIAPALLRIPPHWPIVALWVVSEELGWRSYLVEKLRPAGPALAFALCGLVWFLWHPQYWLDASATWRLGATAFVSVMCLSFVFGWVYHSSGSVWPCLLMHVSNNTMSLGVLKGVTTCAAAPPVVSDVVVPLLLTVLVLWRLGGFRALQRDEGPRGVPAFALRPGP